MPASQSPRVIAVGPLPPEKAAYALARYSRSPDSIRESLEWVRTHDSQKFLESFYFQYGHASIADLGHVTLCFEGVSELAATEIEDEPLWDGQARSTRYQDFGNVGYITPPDFEPPDAAAYAREVEALLEAYQDLHTHAAAHLSSKLPRPEEMKPAAYERNIRARAFDVARYLLPFGIPTGVGQVTSIRTLERQIRRLKISPYLELRQLADEMAAACAQPPACIWDGDSSAEPLAPTLAKYVDADSNAASARAALRSWADRLPPANSPTFPDIDLSKPEDTVADIVASLIFPASDLPYRRLYEFACGLPSQKRREIIDLAMSSRGRGDELLREFRSAPYVFDIVMDIGAYRDLHRHRRCIQLRQNFTTALGYETPALVEEMGFAAGYRRAIERALEAASRLPKPGADYLLPFATRSRFLFKMDFAEAEYISRLRSGVKGHFSYRQVAWKMKEAMEAMEPELTGVIQATPPWIEDPLKR